MDKENLIEINDELLNSINRGLEKKYQKGLISVLELEKNTKILENIRNNSHIKEKLSMIYKEDLKEYEKGLQQYNDFFAEKFIGKFCTDKEDIEKRLDFNSLY